MKIHDVSAPLGEATEPWPGDVPFELEAVARIAEGDACNVAALRTSPHNGTHADAPRHVVDGGEDAAGLPLAPFVGPAVVLERERALGLEGEALERAVPEGHRVLLRSGRTDFRTFPDRVPGVPAGWIDALAGRAVPLLGVDLPSVDERDSRELPAHRACVRRGIQILENLRLEGVEPGVYRLVALPLRLEGADASPVRAVLLEG